MKPPSLPPLLWKPLLTLLYLVAMLAGIVRFVVHDSRWGLVLLFVSYGLFRLSWWLWPPAD